jgi:dTDP-4-amino-4,6-dideoxygalactose transaminase
MIPYGKQNIDEDDIESVVNVLRSPLITQGLIVPKFERSISRLTGSKYSVSFNSATSALHSACLA